MEHDAHDTLCTQDHKIVRAFSFTVDTLPIFKDPIKEAFFSGINYIEVNGSKHEGAVYKEVFPGKTEAHLSLTVDVRGSNLKWRPI